MSQTLNVSELTINGYVLSVTTRDCGDDPAILEELTFRTIGAWLYIVDTLLAHENYVFDGGSVEQRYVAEKEIESLYVSDELDSRVTTWDTFRGQKRVNFHLNSDDIPQVAINVWRANQVGIERARAKFEKQSSYSAPNAPKSANTGDSRPSPEPQATTAPTVPQNTPNTPAPMNGVIRATLGPTKTRPQYADGQLVEFVINRIEATSDKGISIIKLWSPVSSQWAVSNVFKTKTNSTEPSPSWLAIKDTIDSIGLTMDQPSVGGSWLLLTKAAHKDGKEFMNPQSLKAI